MLKNLAHLKEKLKSSLKSVLPVFIIVLLATNIVIVPQAAQFVVERLGVYSTTWNAGIHVKIPFIDRIAKVVTLKEKVVEIIYDNLKTEYKKRNMTFAIELYLKLLLANNGKTIDELKNIGHNLYSLYNALEDTQKKEIYQKFKRPLIYNIPEEISNIASAFSDWRYLVLNKANHNNKKLCVKPFFIKELAEVLSVMCKTVLKNN